jgi:Mg-chelatase subunit ChlD
MGVKREICRLRLARFGAAAACFVVVLGAVSIMRQAAAANRPCTLIFVIDSSERMAPYLAAVKGAVFATIEESKSGDTLGIISFSDIPRRLIVK